MSYSFPQLEAQNGHGFAHEIFVKGSMPRELVANVEGDPELWPLAVLFANAPRLLSACRAANVILKEVSEEYEWLASEQLRLDAALAECRMAIATIDAAGQLASAQSARR